MFGGPGSPNGRFLPSSHALDEWPVSDDWSSSSGEEDDDGAARGRGAAGRARSPALSLTGGDASSSCSGDAPPPPPGSAAAKAAALGATLGGDGPTTNKAAAEAAARVCESKAVAVRLQAHSTAFVDYTATFRVDPAIVYSLLADPSQHARFFESIEWADSQLVSSDGPRRTYRLDYRARWAFWKIRGACTNRLTMTADDTEGKVTFQLREPGFLRTYEGFWTISGAPAPAAAGGPAALARCLDAAAVAAPLASASAAALAKQGGPAAAAAAAAAAGSHPSQQQLATISVRSYTRPAHVPPPPINQCLKGQARGQLEDMVAGLVAEAERVQRERDAAALGAPPPVANEATRLPVEELKA